MVISGTMGVEGRGGGDAGCMGASRVRLANPRSRVADRRRFSAREGDSAGEAGRLRLDEGMSNQGWRMGMAIVLRNIYSNFHRRG
jgi:hypothetical protein